MSLYLGTHSNGKSRLNSVKKYVSSVIKEKGGSGEIGLKTKNGNRDL